MDALMNGSDGTRTVETVAPVDGVFDFRHARFFTKPYMETFYRDKPPTNDERVVLEFLVDQLARLDRRAVVLEVGCGPTVHHVLPFVPYAYEVHMADYLPENLEEVRRWRDSAAGAYQWDQYTRLVLDLEQRQTSPAAIHERESQARALVCQLLPCDLKTTHILAQPITYEVVSAFYCTEEVGIDIGAWETVIANLCRTVAPGGMLYLSCLRNTDYYMVGGTRFPCACISEEDLRRVLPELGFDMSQSVVEGVAVEHQEDKGVVGVVLVAARKKR